MGQEKRRAVLRVPKVFQIGSWDPRDYTEDQQGAGNDVFIQKKSSPDLTPEYKSEI
jgi:hypothetical protein